LRTKERKKERTNERRIEKAKNKEKRKKMGGNFGYMGRSNPCCDLDQIWSV